DVDVLARFGEHIGMAFQLADDVLDIASESAVLGKTSGTDLRAGVATLPVLYARQSTDSADARLRALLDGPLEDEAEHAEVLRLLRPHPAMGQAQAVVRRHADEARAVLAALPDLPARRALEALCDSVVTRTA
ncbi:MAG: polyprenyl synthetase family protein, partial [Jiangellaceae bacterium]